MSGNIRRKYGKRKKKFLLALPVFSACASCFMKWRKKKCGLRKTEDERCSNLKLQLNFLHLDIAVRNSVDGEGADATEA